MSQRLRQTRLSNRAFETYVDILEAACVAWNRIVGQPRKIIPIGTPEWAQKGQSLRLLASGLRTVSLWMSAVPFPRGFQDRTELWEPRLPAQLSPDPFR